jgi:hypothetical protein
VLKTYVFSTALGEKRLCHSKNESVRLIFFFLWFAQKLPCSVGGILPEIVIIKQAMENTFDERSGPI